MMHWMNIKDVDAYARMHPIALLCPTEFFRDLGGTANEKYVCQELTKTTKYYYQMHDCITDAKDNDGKVRCFFTPVE